MAKQSTVWLSDKGEVCKSEKDALLADASDAIDEFITQYWTGSSHAVDNVHVFLTHHHVALRNLLVAYEDAVYQRREEVNGE